MSGRGGTFFTVSGLMLLAYLWLRQSCPVCKRCAPPAAAPAAATPAQQLSHIESTLMQSQLARIKFLESENDKLRKRADAKQATSLSIPEPAPAAGGAPPPPASGKRQWWYWTDLVMDSLRPFERLNGGITQRGLRLAEQKCKISTWCHRAQVIDGRLYITDIRSIFFDRYDAPLTMTLALYPYPHPDPHPHPHHSPLTSPLTSPLGLCPLQPLRDGACDAATPHHEALEGAPSP